MSNNYYIVNNLSAVPIRSVGEYNSELIQVENNTGRDITARASYITNFDDFTVSLSGGNINIG
jgi:hypothetical protein